MHRHQPGIHQLFGIFSKRVDKSEKVSYYEYKIREGQSMLEKLFKSIIDQDTAPIVVCDTESVIVYMNMKYK